MPALRPFKPAAAIVRIAISVLLAAALVPAAPLGSTPSALAANLTVNSSADPGDGTCDGTCTLRDAILGAALSAGHDTITFSAGVTSTIVLGSALPNITQPLTIDGSGQSIKVDGANAYRVFYATAPLTLTALTVQRGRAPADAFGGGGAYFGSAGTILGSTFMSNTTPAHNGGGAWIEGAAFVSGTAFLTNTAFINAGGLYMNTGSITGSTFISNSAGLEGGGLFLFTTGAITGSTFTRNRVAATFSSDGGGATIVGAGSLVNTNFISNTAVRNGGGVRFYGAAAITGGTFTGNSAGTGGGAYLLVGGAVTNTTFISNTAFADGGGLYMGLSAASLSGPIGGDVAPITGATFTGNRADGGGGGGAYLSDASAIQSSTFTRNSALSTGGGLFAIGGVTLTSTSFHTNTAITGGGGAFNTASVSGGGFFGNTATGSGGGAIFNGEANVNGATFSRNTASGPGGGANFGAMALLTNTTFFSNTTTGLGSGGGGGSFGQAVITGTSFISNTAANGIGGGGYFGGGTVITGTTFTGNRAECGGNRLAQPGSRAPSGPQCGKGGGGYFVSPSMAAYYLKMNHNQAARDGGGAYIAGGNVTIEASRIELNTAGERGGGTFVLSAEYRLYGSYSRNNQAGLAGGGLFAETSLIYLDNDVFALNNAIDASGADDIHTSPDGTKLTSRHVTYVSPSSAGFAVSVGKLLEGDAATFINTIFDGYDVAVQGQSPTSTVSMTVIVWSNTATPFSIGDYDVNQQIFGSAAFVNAAGGDYHLTGSSAAINIGVPTNLTIDLDGNPRNVGGAPDAGAFERSVLEQAYKVYNPLYIRL